MSLLLLMGDGITGATATEPELRVQVDFAPPVATDVTDDVQAVTFSRGKQRELDRYQAGRGSVVLKNSDRQYDPTHSTDTAFLVDLFEQPAIVTHAAPQITGNLDLRIKVAPESWVNGGGDQNLIATLSDSYDFYTLFMADDGQDMRLGFDYNGNLSGAAVEATERLPFVFEDGTAYTLRVTLEFQAALNQSEAVFYWSDDYDFDTQTGTWNQLGDAVLSADTSTALQFTANDPIYVGVDGNFNAPLDGLIYAFEIRDGINGTVVASQNFTRSPWLVGMGDGDGATFDDPQGNPWTIYDGRIVYVGTESVEAFDDPGPEGFEDDTLAYDVIQYAGNSAPWARANDQAHTGTWSYKSGAIGHSQTSAFTIPVPANATHVRFWVKVSSELDSDLFRVYGGFSTGDLLNTRLIPDADFLHYLSGEVDWTELVLDLRGFSYVTFRYNKDSSVVEGSDAAWIDDLSFECLGETTPIYAGNIKPQKRIRVPVNYNGTTHMLVEGYVDSWDQVRRGPHTGAAVVSFTDGFKILNKTGLPSSPYAVEVAADSPYAWYRCGEPSGSALLYDAVGSVDGVVTGSPGFGSESLVDREPDTAVLFDDVTQYVEMPSGAVPSASVVTFELWVTFNNGDATAIFDTVSQGAGSFALSRNGASGGLVATTDAGSTLTATNPLTDGTRYHVAAVYETGAFPKIYLNGVDASASNVGVVQSGNLTTGAWKLADNTGLNPDFVLDELAIYSGALSTTRLLAHNAAGRTPWTGDSPGERAERVLDLVGWSEFRRELDDGNSVLQGTTLGMSALEHLQKVGESEFGKVFIDKHGNVRLVSRENQWNGTSVGTVTDDSHYQSSDPEYGDDLIRNDVTVSRSEGVAQNWKDQDSIDEYYINSYTLDGLYHDDDDLSRYAAQYIVDVYKDPLLRIAQVTIKPMGNPSTLFPLLLALELGDWITVEETPQDVGSTTVHTCIVEGISLDWTPKDWTFSLNLSPADTRAYWLAGVEGFSNAGVSTRAGF